MQHCQCRSDCGCLYKSYSDDPRRWFSYFEKYEENNPQKGGGEGRIFDGLIDDN